MALEIVASLTDVARQNMTQQLLTGKSFVVDRFSVNNAGHDPSNPTIALTPDTTLVACPGGTPLYGPEAITSSSIVSAYCPQFECDLPESVAVGVISNVCLLARWVYSPSPNDPDINTYFLYALGNRPMMVKVGRDNFKILVSIQY